MADCVSCGMPLRTSEDFPNGDTTIPYCKRCANSDGTLKSYEQIHAGMTEFLIRTQAMDKEFAARSAAAMLADKPAWKNKQENK